MAQRALEPGRPVPRRRVVFGAFDADGWAWASLKAFVWLIIIIFVLGYLPDRAYYLTVNRTLDLGLLAWSPVNLCPPGNEDLPCPAPVGSVGPWHASPQELSLPQPRTDGTVVQLGSRILYIGGSDGTAAQSSVFVAPVVPSGNFDKWTQGPPLPEGRADAAVLFEAGSIYVFGGIGPDGKPTTTAYVLTPDAATGNLGAWKTDDTLKLPEPRSAAAVAAAPDGILLIGGSNAQGPVNSTWRAVLDPQGKLKPWAAEAPLFAPQTSAAAFMLGDFVWLWGGSDQRGPTTTVQRGEFGAAAAPGQPANPNAGKIVRWGVNDPSKLPAPRSNGSAWSANGAIYWVGGTDGKAPQTQLYWALPTSTGNIPEWKHLDQSDLETAIEGAAPIVNGPDAILVGGKGTSGVVATSVRSNIAPAAPFFQVGLVGMTIPALNIQGEIGQQLGYLNAAGVGTVFFVLLLVLGWAFAHKDRVRAFAEEMRARRRHR